MPLRPKIHPDAPPYPRRRPRRLGLGLCGVIVAGALGCTTTVQPPPVTPEVVASARSTEPTVEPEPAPPRPAEPDWQLDDDMADFEEAPAPDPAEVVLAERPPVAVATPTHGARIMGSISREIIREGIRAGLDDIRACYSGPAGEGLGDTVAVSTRFTIAHDGTVSEAEARVDAEGGEALSACLGEVLRSLQFPSVPGGGFVIISYPFRFESA